MQTRLNVHVSAVRQLPVLIRHYRCSTRDTSNWRGLPNRRWNRPVNWNGVRGTDRWDSLLQGLSRFVDTRAFSLAAQIHKSAKHALLT